MTLHATHACMNFPCTWARAQTLHALGVEGVSRSMGEALGMALHAMHAWMGCPHAYRG